MVPGSLPATSSNTPRQNTKPCWVQFAVVQLIFHSAQKPCRLKHNSYMAIWESMTLQLLWTQSSIVFYTEQRQMMIKNIFAGIVVQCFVHYSMKERTCETQLLHWFWDKLSVVDTNCFKSLSNYTPVSKQPPHTWLLINWGLLGAYLRKIALHQTDASYSSQVDQVGLLYKSRTYYVSVTHLMHYKL